MTDFPEFAQSHYRVEKELGHNRAGGRVTYLGVDTRTQQPVVIKQFQFAKSQSWADLDLYEREIQVLQDLNHPGIPQYLDSFHTEDGFCMVQEYKQATSLATSRSFDPDEIRCLAIAALEVLVYLQNRIPPVIHRDIKPENLLVDTAGQVYLVDFGFARVGDGEVGVSSVVKGTLGFMPPEQLFNRQLTEASDLYGLGMTLICLLTNTKSNQIGELVDISYRVSFKHLVPNLSRQWIEWLEKMVEPRLNDRFPNAVAALSALPTSPLRPPEALLSQATLLFKAERPGEILMQPVTITNPVPETNLTGRWEVAFHPHDPSPDLYEWIAIEPSDWQGTQIDCHIIVNTQRLMSGKIYSRKVLLHTNTLAKTITLNIQVQTAPRFVPVPSWSYQLISLLALICLGLGWGTGWLMQAIAGFPEATSLGTLLGGAIGLEGVAWLMRSSGWRTGATASTLLATALGSTILMQILGGLEELSIETTELIGAGLGAGSGAMTGLVIGNAVEQLLVENGQKKLTIGIVLLIALFTGSLGLILALKSTNTPLVMLTSISGFMLMAMMLHLQLHRLYLVFKGRKSERSLIKP